MKRLLLALVFVSGCSALQNVQPLITAQHPAWAMNPGDCAILGAVIAPLLGLVPVASAATLFGTIAGKAFCQGESALVAGPPAVVPTPQPTSVASQ